MIQELQNEMMYALFAPDGSWQAMTLAPDFPTCIGIIKTLHSKGLSKSFHQLVNLEAYKILPVRITMTQSDDENTAC